LATHEALTPAQESEQTNESCFRKHRVRIRCAVCRQLCAELEEFFYPKFRDAGFGGEVDKAIFAIVAVDVDAAENERLCGPHNEAGSHEHWFSGKKVRFISLAVPVNPELIEGAGLAQAGPLVAGILLARLSNPGVTIPKGFDYPVFSKALQDAVEAYLSVAAPMR
jgi:hypothetical protein